MCNKKKKISWSPDVCQKEGRDSWSHETEVGEKIAATGID